MSKCAPSLYLPVLSGLLALASASALLLSGCAVEVQNTLPAKELAQTAKPPGSVYVGWRLFQEKCAACHGPAANGTSNGPDLLPRVAAIGPRQFVSLVLKRYDWNLSASKAASEGAAREAMIDDVLQRNPTYATQMPAWESSPRVSAHIVDLYAYLSSRARGVQGPGLPAQ